MYLYAFNASSYACSSAPEREVERRRALFVHERSFNFAQVVADLLEEIILARYTEEHLRSERVYVSDGDFDAVVSKLKEKGFIQIKEGGGGTFVAKGTQVNSEDWMRPGRTGFMDSGEVNRLLTAKMKERGLLYVWTYNPDEHEEVANAKI